MIDFIKVSNAGINPDAFISNPHLSFTDKVILNTGELVDEGRSAKYRDMKFFISRSGITGLSGSLHKYHNEGLHNHNDFTFENLRSVITDLEGRFGIDPWTTALNNIEFGVNLNVPFNPSDFISHLVTHNYSQFNIEQDKGKHCSQVKYSQYVIKIYNKGLQYNLNENILRFEVRVVRMAKLNKYDIHTLSDLLDKEKLLWLLNLLLQVFDEIIYYDDSIDPTSLSRSDRELLRDGYNPKYWQEYHKKAGSNSSKKIRRYQDLVRIHEHRNFQSIRQLLISKWKYLLQKPIEEVRDITDCTINIRSQKVRDITIQQLPVEQKEIRDFTTSTNNLSHENPTPTIFEDVIDTDTSSYNLSIEKDLVPGALMRICPVTGLNISMQKGTSRFLSITGIKYYQANDSEIFKRLQQRLTSTWTNEPIEKQIFEIAHSIRNSFHSKRIHTQKAIKRLCSSPALFDNYDLVCQHKKNIATQ